MNRFVITLLAAAGLATGCNRSVESASQKFNELPPAVQKTVRAQAPQAEIADVSHKTDNGMDVYEIQLREGDRNPRLVVAADGKLVTTDMAPAARAGGRLLPPTAAAGTKFTSLPWKR